MALNSRIIIVPYLVSSLTAIACAPHSAPTSVVSTSYRNFLGMDFVDVPSGQFQMGTGRDSLESKKPHVTLDAFQIMQTEVTNAQFEQYKKRNRHPRSPHDESPVVNLTRFEVLEFIGWLNEKTGDTYRLPTEAEWEYAARAGSNANFPWGDEWRDDLAFGTTSNSAELLKVKQYPPNNFGLYDVIGNASEMTYDRYSDLRTGQLRNPVCYREPEQGDTDYDYVVRGLGVGDVFPWVWYRSIGVADIPLSNEGFRLVRGQLPVNATRIEPLDPKEGKR